jgi:hypothetical protein
MVRKRRGATTLDEARLQWWEESSDRDSSALPGCTPEGLMMESPMTGRRNKLRCPLNGGTRTRQSDCFAFQFCPPNPRVLVLFGSVRNCSVLAVVPARRGTLLPSLSRAATASSSLIRPMPSVYDMQPLPPARRLQAPSSRCLRWTPHTDKPSFYQTARKCCVQSVRCKSTPFIHKRMQLRVTCQ